MSYQTFTDQWETFLLKAGQYFNVMANYEFLLFIIGIQESGKGFGNFSKMARKSRQGRNPKTGASVKIPGSFVAKFKPGKDLKDALN